MGLPRNRRIRSGREIAGLLDAERARGSILELYWRPATGSRPRATCVVPKHGHGSVERNRLRRRLQELIRDRLLSRADDRDWLIRARPTAYETSFDDLADELRALTERVEEADG